MGWLRRAESKASLPSGEQTVIPLDPFGTGRPNLDGMIWPDSTYDSFARLGFSRNELVYACIMEKAQSLPQGVLRVYPQGGSEPIEDHRLRQLIAHPNEVTSEFQFFELSVVHLDLAGNCYWLIQRANDGAPAELWPLRPDLVRIIPRGARLWDYGYVLEPDATARGASPDVIPISRRDVIHIKYPNPLSPYFGLPPLRAAARAITVDNGRTDFVDSLLRNDAVPRAVVTTQQEVSEQVIERLRAKWIRRFSGDNRGSPAFLQAGMDVKVLGLNLQDLEFTDLSAMSEARICMVLNVPPILISAKVGLDRSTYANYREARASFWEEALFSLQRKFREAVEHQLVPEFTGVGRRPVTTGWDNSTVPALREAETERWERAINGVVKGVVTKNEGRKVLGLDPVPGGDVFLIPAGVTESGTGDSETSPPELEAAGNYADRFLTEIKTNGELRTISPSRNGKEPVDHG